MPIYMDVHIVPGVKAIDVAAAHQLDLAHQTDHGCKCMTYWIDEERENIFCLIEAPSKEAVMNLHNDAHGLIPSKIIEVSSAVVTSFLGRIYDPETAENSPEGLKVFTDPSFRILLLTKITDPFLLRHQLGAAKAGELLDRHNEIVRRNLLLHGGREAEYEGSSFVISFSSASKAVACAVAIQKEMQQLSEAPFIFQVAIHAGEPVAHSNELFGDTIQFAHYMCAVAGQFQIALTSSVRELVSKDYFHPERKFFVSMSRQDEDLLKLLFTQLEDHWQDADFDLTRYCHLTTMSISQLYRKTMALTGLSPNALLKEFRLEKAKQLMRKQHCNVAQVTFDCGFSSPSYFTKCFKKKFGLLPMAYLELLH